MLEEQGVVGPADGAKPREVFADKADITSLGRKESGFDESEDLSSEASAKEEEEGSEWQKV
jgi:hypothetical protein